MALTIPSTDDFYQFWGDNADTSDEDRATLLLNLAADLLWLATDLSDDPTDSRLANLVELAIIDMAVYLYISREDLDATYSPFQSERVGSYSYSKTYARVRAAVAINDSTGVPLFDMVVGYLSDMAYAANGGWVSSINLYDQPYVPLRLAAFIEFGNYLADYTPGNFSNYGSPDG